MKNILLVTLLLVMSAMSQTVEAQDAGGYYDAFLSVNENVDLTQLRNAGLKITARFDGIITAEVPNTLKPNDLKSFSGIKHAAAATTLLTCCDSVRYYSRVDPVHQGLGLDMPYGGKDVIVGVIDCGFDFNHINLCDNNGVTRVKAVYLPFDNTGRTVMINRIALPGSSFETLEKIQALTTDDPSTPHGTQVAGIAAGGYKANGWHGVAPEADIVVCGIPEAELNDVKLAHCIAYISDYAQRAGKPCVVNISMGTNAGPHDGSSFLDRVVEQLSGPGRVFVISAGNDGGRPVFMRESIESKNDTVTALLSGYDGGLMCTGYINAWSRNRQAFNTRMIVVDKNSGDIVYRTRPLGTTAVGVTAEFDTESDELLAEYCKGRVVFTGNIVENGNASSLMDLNIKPKKNQYAIGFQYYSSSYVNLYVWGSQYAYFNDYNFPWASSGVPEGSINELATTDSIISVGSYNTKQYVPLRDGTMYYRSHSVPEELSYFSSYGFDANGVVRPDVCAPGSVVVSSANRYDTDAPNLRYWQPSAFVDGVEYPYCPDLGTSMSAPVVTGAIALWMQVKPDLSAADVRNILQFTCKKDSQVVSGDSKRWGHGKLDVNAGMRYLLGLGPMYLKGDVNGDGEVNVSDINMVIDIILGGSAPSDVMGRADVNEDGEISLSDINEIIDIIMS